MLHHLRLESQRALVFGTEAIPFIMEYTGMAEKSAEDIAALLFFVLDYKDDMDCLLHGDYDTFILRHAQWPADAHLCLSHYFSNLSAQITECALASLDEERSM